MQKRRTKTFALRKTMSNTMSQAPTATDIAENLIVCSKRYLFDSAQELNLSKLCLSNKQNSDPGHAQTSRTTVNHLEVAQNINKRFQRTNGEDNPFLRQKLKHILKKWPAQQDQQSPLKQAVAVESWMDMPKFITLRGVVKDNAKKQAEFKTSSNLNFKLH